jgi:hypothetical protein
VGSVKRIGLALRTIAAEFLLSFSTGIAKSIKHELAD